MASSQIPWWKNAAIYQIYPASYKDSNGDGVGDIQGIISCLDYIKSLGVDAIWVCPFYDSPQHDMGYDVADYESVYPPYGTVADVEALIAGCHARGMRVLFDLVINHTSYLHTWFKESRSSKNSVKRDWYIWRPAKYDKHGSRHPPNNWRSCFGGSAWEWDEPTQEYYLHLFCKEQPDLNWENPATRAAIYESAIEFWLRKGVDGFRVDTVNMYSKTPGLPDAPLTNSQTPWQDASALYCNGPRMHEYLREMNEVLEKHGAMTVGELPNTSALADVLSYVSAKERQLSMIFQFDIVNVGMGLDIRYDTIPKNWTLHDIRPAVQRVQDVMNGTDGWSTAFLENHDTARAISRFGSDETPELWERSGKMLAMFVASLSGTLFVYQGQEIGMVNAPATWPISEYKDVESQNYYNHVRQVTGDDPLALARAKAAIQYLARDHGRLPMQWNGMPNAGFTEGHVTTWMNVHDNYEKINVKRQTVDPNSLLSFWKAILRVRKEHPQVFAHGDFAPLERDHESVLAYEKTSTNQRLVAVFNFTKEKQTMDLIARLDLKEPVTLAKNYADEPVDVLRPFEGRLYLMGQRSS
ncbi:glycoside hydrolase superfamily [Lipomyces tetrasporus]